MLKVLLFGFRPRTDHELLALGPCPVTVSVSLFLSLIHQVLTTRYTTTGILPPVQTGVAEVIVLVAVVVK